MFLRCMIIILSLLLLSSVFDNPNNFDNSKLKGDIKILESIHQRKPDDLKIVKMLVQSYFLIENFTKVIFYSNKYLSVNKDKEIAYLQIISLINLNERTKARREIGKYLSDYNLNRREIEIINYKKNIINSKFIIKGYPEGTRRIRWGENKIILSILEREGLIFGHDNNTDKYFFQPIGQNEKAGTIKAPEFLNDIELNKVIYISQSNDRREVLISMLAGKDRAEILYRKFDIVNKSWSRLIRVDVLNKGRWNCFGNFIHNSRAIIFSSNRNSKNGKEFYISARMNFDEWSDPIPAGQINSPLDEYSIVVHPDGETVYFSSNGFKGLGGFDIFGCRIKFDGNYKIYNIQNLYKYNTFRNEKFPIIANIKGTEGYLNFMSSGSMRILKIKDLPVKPKPIFYLDGKVYDKKRNIPIGNAIVQISLINNESNPKIIKYTSGDGFFGVSLQANKNLRIMIMADGFQLYSGTLLSGVGGIVKKNFYLSATSEKIEEDVIVKDENKKLEFEDEKKIVVFWGIRNIKSENTVYPNVNAQMQRVLSKERGIVVRSSFDIKEKPKQLGLDKSCISFICVRNNLKKLSADSIIWGSVSKYEKDSYKALDNQGEDQYLLGSVKSDYYEIVIKVYNRKTKKTLVFVQKTSQRNLNKSILILLNKIKKIF